MTIPPIGPRGEVEVTRTSTETNVLIPWRITLRVGIVAGCMVLCLYLLIWAIWWIAAGRDATSLIKHLWNWWPIWILPPFFAFVAPFPLLVVFDYWPKLQNANWPPPWQQQEPGAGFFNAYNMPREESKEPRVVEVAFNGSVSGGENGRTSKHWRLKTGCPHEWQRYARALTGPKLLRPRFSVRAARHFKVIEDEFTNLSHGWSQIGMAERTSDAPNAHTRLTDWGFEYMRSLATCPIPDDGEV
jgi:hypothetical protein